MNIKKTNTLKIPAAKSIAAKPAAKIKIGKVGSVVGSGVDAIGGLTGAGGGGCNCKRAPLFEEIFDAAVEVGNAIGGLISDQVDQGFCNCGNLPPLPPAPPKKNRRDGVTVSPEMVKHFGNV